MASFKAGGKEWTIRLTVGLLGKIKADTGIDLGRVLSDGSGFGEVLTADLGALVGMLWVCCEQQATAAGVSPEDFAGLLGGDELDSATDALLQALILFFPKARGRAALLKHLPRVMEQMIRAGNDLADARLSTFSPTAGDSPASSASTPAS